MLCPIHVSRSRVWSVDSHQSGACISASADSTVKVRHALLLRSICQTVPLSARWVSACPACSAPVDPCSPRDRRWLALPQLWDIGKSECVSTVRAHTSDVYSVRMHPNGTHFVSGGYDKTVRLFDARTGTEMNSLKGHKLVRVFPSSSSS